MGNQKGIIEGLNEGLKKGREALESSMILRLFEKGKTAEEISDLLGISWEVVRKAIDK